MILDHIFNIYGHRRGGLQRRPRAPGRQAVRAEAVLRGDDREGPDPRVLAQKRGKVPLHLRDRVRGQPGGAVQRELREEVPDHVQEQSSH